MYIPRDAYRPRVIDYRQSEAYTHVLRADQTAPPLACPECKAYIPPGAYTSTT